MITTDCGHRCPAPIAIVSLDPITGIKKTQHVCDDCFEIDFLLKHTLVPAHPSVMRPHVN